MPLSYKIVKDKVKRSFYFLQKMDKYSNPAQVFPEVLVSHCGSWILNLCVHLSIWKSSSAFISQLNLKAFLILYPVWGWNKMWVFEILLNPDSYSNISSTFKNTFGKFKQNHESSVLCVCGGEGGWLLWRSWVKQGNFGYIYLLHFCGTIFKFLFRYVHFFFPFI